MKAVIEECLKGISTESVNGFTQVSPFPRNGLTCKIESESKLLHFTHSFIKATENIVSSIYWNYFAKRPVLLSVLNVRPDITEAHRHRGAPLSVLSVIRVL